MLIFVWYFGVKATLKFLAKWPGYALLPTFTPFTFSGTLIKGQKYLTLSYNWTWFNLIFSALGIMTGPFVHYTFADDVINESHRLDLHQVEEYFWGASLAPSLVYLGCFASFGLLTKLQNGKCIQRTAFHLDTFEKVQLDLDQVETVNVACQASMVEQANEQDATKTVIQVWKEVACQTEPKKGLKEKSMELFSMAELMEVFN